MSTIQEKKENFEAWVALIDDRVEDWFMTLPLAQKNKFDYTMDSLDEIQRYMISKFVVDDLRDQRNKMEIDAIASYVMRVFSKHVPNPEFVVELKDERNMLYNLPAIITKPKTSSAFSPYFYFLSIVNLKEVGTFKHALNYMIQNYNDAVGNKKA